MQLKTYPRLNLRTKRLGIEVADWWVIGVALLPGFFLHSSIVFLLCFGSAIVWAAFIKPRKPRGWLSAAVDFYLRRGFAVSVNYPAELESKKSLK